MCCILLKGSDIVVTRLGSAGDHGQVGIALRRSTDRGLTFLPRQDVWRETNHTIGNPAPIWNSRTGEVVLLFSRDNKEVWVMSSKTRGRSWSKPRNISAATVPYAKDWEWVATGPGGGVQIERGPHAGRLVQCCDHMQCSSRGGCKDVTVQEPWNFSHKGSHTIFSDNDGLHWQLGAVVGNGGEVWGGSCHDIAPFGLHSSLDGSDIVADRRMQCRDAAKHGWQARPACDGYRARQRRGVRRAGQGLRGVHIGRSELRIAAVE